MSRHHIEKVTCPSCHHEGDFELWDSINTALDPEMKEKVLNKSIFLYTCPSCGETFRLNYQLGLQAIADNSVEPVMFVETYNKAARKAGDEYVFTDEFVAYVKQQYKLMEK